MLTIDHVNGGGNQHREHLAAFRVNGRASSQEFYRAVREAGYPEGQYQVLCYNCQAAKGPTGVCPCRTAATVKEVDVAIHFNELPGDHDVSAAGLRCIADERRREMLGDPTTGTGSAPRGT